mgnify:CR=1 FL=1
MEDSYGFLKDHPVNQKRVAEGKRPANSVWFWGQGRKAIDDAVKSMKNLPAEFRVTVKVVKENAFSVINNNDTVFRLVEAGMITPEVGLQLLIFDGKDQAIELMKLAPASRT